MEDDGIDRERLQRIVKEEIDKCTDTSLLDLIYKLLLCSA
jgi:hypothetical protein